MITKTGKIKYLQRVLKSVGWYKSSIDGDYGPKTKKAVKKLQKTLKGFGFYRGHTDGLYGPKTKKAVAKFQRINPPLVADGVIGYNTLEAMFINPIKETETKEDSSPSNDKKERYPAETRDQRHIKKFYGAVGKNQTRIKLPYPMRISWDPEKTVKTMLCHKKVSKDMKKIFKQTLEHYGYEQIRELGLDMFAGCLNVRKMRGANRYSTHSWGISVDLDPANNQLRWKSPRARFSSKEYIPFWEIVEANGATSLGRARDFDWMHFQFARI